MKENRDLDQRIQLGANSVAQLIAHGHQVYIQTGAGEGAGFSDEEYIAAGATIVYSAEEVYKRAKLICRVNTPSPRGDRRDGAGPDHLRLRPPLGGLPARG